MKKGNDMSVRDMLIAAGVRNLKEYGYPEVAPDNILTDVIYREFFRSMLQDNKGQGFDAQIGGLLAEIQSADVSA